jgi:hypothetical protein
MESLNLSTCPPRSGLEKLGGFYLLARTIDKIRAHLPDGNPGEYKIPGFSERLLQGLGVSEYDLRARRSHEHAAMAMCSLGCRNAPIFRVPKRSTLR